MVGFILVFINLTTVALKYDREEINIVYVTEFLGKLVGGFAFFPF